MDYRSAKISRNVWPSVEGFHLRCLERYVTHSILRQTLSVENMDLPRFYMSFWYPRELDLTITILQWKRLLRLYLTKFLTAPGEWPSPIPICNKRSLTFHRSYERYHGEREKIAQARIFDLLARFDYDDAIQELWAKTLLDEVFEEWTQIDPKDPATLKIVQKWKKVGDMILDLNILSALLG